MADRTDPVRRPYDRIAAEYDHRWRPYIDATLRAVIDVVRLDGREKTLDVPCGTGELERRLLQKQPNLEIALTRKLRCLWLRWTDPPFHRTYASQVLPLAPGGG